MFGLILGAGLMIYGLKPNSTEYWVLFSLFMAAKIYGSAEEYFLR